MIERIKQALVQCGANKCSGECPYFKEGKLWCKSALRHDILEAFKKLEPKHGHWERNYVRPGVYADLYWWCSVCHGSNSCQDAGRFYKFCPSCGAKMDEVIEYE